MQTVVMLSPGSNATVLQGATCMSIMQETKAEELRVSGLLLHSKTLSPKSKD